MQKDYLKIVRSIALPKRMRSKDLFIHITMKNNNDLVDIITG